MITEKQGLENITKKEDGVLVLAKKEDQVYCESWACNKPLGKRHYISSNKGHYCSENCHRMFTED